MSVINQMLKDLEHRTPEQGQAPMPTVVTQKSSTLKIVSISVVVLLSLNALGFYIWNLQEQKQSAQLQAASLKLQVETKAQEQALSVKLQVEKKVQEQAASVKLQVEKTVQEQAQAQEKKQLIPVVSHKENVDEALALPVKKQEPAVLPDAKISKMSVSRRQLSPAEPVSKKLAGAEKAINLNELSKAEQLFEEILIIVPSHKQARKKLAALWFGRKSYQQAVNLLSQGIAIDRHDGELRLLKARIYLSQGQQEAAFNTLKPLALFEQEEYQVMLANIAQQLEQYPSAINAYQMLIKMQPYSGRWHLGLAIVYDKNSQFSLAVNEYAMALTKADLSTSSAKFAKQRMQALGE